jgi:two-component system chemotaxis response regulator CheB
MQNYSRQLEDMSVKPHVLVVDDVAVLRLSVSKALRESGDFDVVGAARDGREALEMIQNFSPDLVILDLEMPVMNGLDVLQVLAEQPRLQTQPKVLVFSAASGTGADTTMSALRLGALDFVLKPQAKEGFAGLVRELLPRCRGLFSTPGKLDAEGGRDASQAAATTASSSRTFPSQVLAIASSTGGPAALRVALQSLPDSFPVPIVIVQHIPPLFSASLAQSLDRDVSLPVCEAAAGQILQPGHVYLAPGGFHMVIGENGIIELNEDDPVMGLRPVADYCFSSLANWYGPAVVAAVFTGMGNDGLQGCRDVRAAGGVVLSQKAESCVVYGMPRAVDEARLAEQHFDPESFGSTLQRYQWQWMN